jgi:hypothetical protein
VEPLAGVFQTVEKRQVCRLRFPGPQDLEELHGHIRQIDQMPVHTPHVLNPGSKCDQVVVSIPGRIRSAQGLLSPTLCNLLERVRLRLREEVYKERKKEPT